MPETFLLFRFFFKYLGYTQEWRNVMSELTDEERTELYPIAFKNDFNHIEQLTDNKKYLHILQFYKNYRGDMDPEYELYKFKKAFDESMKANSYSVHK